MICDLEQKSWKDAACDWLVVPATCKTPVAGLLKDLDAALGGRIARLRETGDLTGKVGELIPVFEPSGFAAKRLLFAGVGDPAELDLMKFEKAMVAAARRISDKTGIHVAVALPDSIDAFPVPRLAQSAVVAMSVGSVGQDLYKTEPARHAFARVSVLAPAGRTAADLAAAVKRGGILGQSMNFTRELVNRSPDEIYPAVFADRARQVAEELGLVCTVFDEKRLKEERAGAMLAVGKGSSRDPRLVILEYRGAGEKAPVLGLVGKGVTFDSGGLSLKPPESMAAMKCDMAGAATVLGAISAIARLELPVNVRGFMGLVENMISGAAYKLGDILTARNGVTIEVLNTDAEGRLVLADVLSYAVDTGVDRIIDLATLTGACVVALGEDVTGAFTNDQSWCDRVLEAARASGELIWQLPMFDLYADLIKSDVGDIKNIGGRWGGAITAAKFLERFVSKKPWVHLDIAGPSFVNGNKPDREGGGTAAMLRTLVAVAEKFAAP